MDLPKIHPVQTYWISDCLKCHSDLAENWQQSIRGKKCSDRAPPYSNTCGKATELLSCWVELNIWFSKHLYILSTYEACRMCSVLCRYQRRNEVRWRPGQEASLVPHVRNWALLQANLLHWRKYLWHCWNFSAPPAAIWRPHSDSAHG